ncbi:MAG TPA: redoxin domain-containing protein [Alphaproteobacteria bacterium]
MKQILMMAFVALLALNSFAQAQDSPRIAPDFTATDTKGAPQSIAQYKGKIVVLEWTNPECPYVKKHYGSGSMQALQKTATADGVVWLRINSGAPGKQGHQTPAEFDATATDVTANIIDETGTIGKLYHAKTTPHMFVIDKNGIIAYEGAIDDKPTTDADDLKDARNYVKDVLDDLKNDRTIGLGPTQPYGCGIKYAD